MRSLKLLAAPLLAAVSLDAAAQEPAGADLVLTGGRIATLAHREGFVEALAVKDGLVHATGSAAELARHVGEGTQVIELEGRAVIPGLTDSHLHVVRGGRFYDLELRWEGVRTLREALERVREQAARTPAGHWVRVVGGWSPYQFEERRMPTVAELNAAAPATPVLVLFLYSKGLLNRAGVEALGVTLETPTPEGTAYRFVDGGAELLAVPRPTLLYQTVAKLPHLSAEEQLASSLRYFRELARLGLTGAVDAGGGGHEFPEDYRAAERLAREGRMPLRVSYYLFPQKPGRELADLERWTRAYAIGHDQALELPHGYELDGAGENLVWAAGDFENFLAARPELAEEADALLFAAVSRLAESRWPFRIHATYGESIERMLDVFERVDAEHPLDGLRWLFDHAETIRPEQIARAQRLGGGFAIQDRMAFAGELFLERYGAEAAAQAPPLRRLLESGVPLGAGTDGTRVASYDPWVSLYWMVSGRTVGGTQLYGPENRLSRLEALELYTKGSAWVAGEEHLRGALTPGRYADLVVLSADYFSVPEEQLRGIESLLTIVGGRVTHAAGPWAALAPEPPPAAPAWSPVTLYPGVAR